MSNKYIPQVNNTNFVFPNAYLAEYDIDLIQNLNESSVFGSVSGFTASTITSSGMTISFNYNWVKNNADVFIYNNELRVLSLHMLAAGQNYFKPWRLVGQVSSPLINSAVLSGTASFTVTPAMLGLSTFVTGTYYFEIRIIGQKAIYAICQTLSITI